MLTTDTDGSGATKNKREHPIWAQDDQYTNSQATGKEQRLLIQKQPLQSHINTFPQYTLSSARNSSKTSQFYQGHERQETGVPKVPEKKAILSWVSGHSFEGTSGRRAWRLTLSRNMKAKKVSSWDWFDSEEHGDFLSHYWFLRLHTMRSFSTIMK